MAYCSKCGAYIPDGQTVCLACGNDSEQEKAQNSQAQTKQAAYDDTGNFYSFTNEELREKLEEQRKKQQEQSRKWAEQEKERRERERESVKDNWKTYTAATQNRAQNTVLSKNSNTKLLSILSYISILFLVPMLFFPEDRKAGFHAKQGLRLLIYSVLCDVITWIPAVGTLLQISRIYLMIRGIINAANGREEALPVIGKIGEKK